MPAQGRLGATQGASAGGKLSVLTQYLGHGIAGLTGYLLGGVHGAIEGTGRYTIAKGAVDALRPADIERTDQLLTEALLNPELARTLLMKATPANRPFVAQRLGSQLGTLATTASNRASTAAAPNTAVSSLMKPGASQIVYSRRYHRDLQ